MAVICGKYDKTVRLKPCPSCHEAWMYCSEGDYYSGYESRGYRVNCRCGKAWKAVTWQETKEKAIKLWNEWVDKGSEDNEQVDT